MRFNIPTTIMPIPTIHLIRSGKNSTKIPTIIMTIPGIHVPIACCLLDIELGAYPIILIGFVSIPLSSLVQTRPGPYPSAIFFTDNLSLTSLGVILPADMTIFKASSTDISVRTTSSSLTTSRKPDIGLGEVGIKM